MWPAQQISLDCSQNSLLSEILHSTDWRRNTNKDCDSNISYNVNIEKTPMAGYKPKRLKTGVSMIMGNKKPDRWRLLSFSPVLIDHLPLCHATGLTQADSTKQAQKYWASPGNASPHMIAHQQPITYPLTTSLDPETLPNSDCLREKLIFSRNKSVAPVAASNHQRNWWDPACGKVHKVSSEFRKQKVPACTPFPLGILLKSWLSKPVR